MSRRSSSLNNYTGTGITREIDSKYDVIKKVSNYLPDIGAINLADLPALTAALNEAKDFTGITVVTGAVASWDEVSKTLTVPTLQGIQGIQGVQGEVGPTGPTGARGAKGDQGVQGVDGTQGPTGLQGVQGPQGKKGDKGDTGLQGEVGATGPVGPKGADGTDGDKGDRGISVHHLKPTSTTEIHGKFAQFGEKDTYTFYGDPGETQVLGWFTVGNGINNHEDVEALGVMLRRQYDTDDSGVVDNAEALGGKSLEQVEQERDDLLDTKLDKAGGTIENDLTVSGNLYVNGTETIVNTETVLVEDNELVINYGEIGPGVTKGVAGIRVDRGTEADYLFHFDEVSDSFKIGDELGLQKVATREDAPLNTGIAIWDATSSKFNTTRDVDVDSLTVSGLVDGRDVSADGAKLDTIEANAKDDQTGAEIKALYEAELDTNAYTDAEKSKLAIIEDGATADQTAEEIEALYESNPDTNKYTHLEKQFVDVTTTLGTAATTLPSAVNEVHSEVGSIVDGTTDIVFDNAASGLAATTVEGAINEVEGRVDTTESKLAGIQAGAQVNAVTSVAGRPGAVTLAKGDVGLSNVDNTSDINKPLSTATSSALSGKVDKVTGKGLSDTNYTQAEKTKLDGIATGATKNATDAQLINRATHTGVQPISSVTGLQTGLDNKADTSYVNTQLDSKADKTVSVVAGTGLSGGGTLAANRTLNVTYGTTAGTAAQGNDSRITGALQKSEVVQATGTSTTNVMSQNAVTDALSAKANTSTLGTAATRDVGTDSGNVMEVGAFGLGSPAILPSGTDLNTFTTNGSYDLPSAVNRPSGTANWGYLRVIRHSVPNGYCYQEWTELDSANARTYYRIQLGGTWQPWRELYHTGNILTTTGQSTDFPMSQKAVTDALGQANTSTIPLGVIVMWSGSTATIPTGWALCNGANGTPDLRDRFVVGAGSTYAVGATGGNANAIVPAHSHTASIASGGGHSHTGTANSGGAHTHTTAIKGSPERGDNRDVYDYGSSPSVFNHNSSSAGAHTHSLSISSGGAHTHTATVNSTGVSVTNANLPPYYALAYIMKL